MSIDSAEYRLQRDFLRCRRTACNGFLITDSKKSGNFEKNSEKHLIFAKNRDIIVDDDSKPKDRKPSGL